MDGKLVRDPIHNYINITSIEQPIVDDKEFQRLRFVYQNSTAYLTYPSNTNTRFLHSLGVMQLSGKFFSSALENSDEKTLNNFLAVAKTTIQKQINQLALQNFEEEIKADWKKSLGNACHFAHHPFHGLRSEVHNTSDSDGLFLINTLWQAVRIAGLCHDIGHFPMSHLFETVHKTHEGKNTKAAVEAIERRKKYQEMLAADLKAESERHCNIPLHELRGQMIFAKIMGGGASHYARLVHSMARSILTYDPHYHDDTDSTSLLYRCLHRLVDGELDADRLDYCLRDPQQSGFEHDAIDVQRIINNFVLHEESGRFKILPTDKALSAVETFFHHRFFVYKYVIYHHNVSRLNGVLEKILLSLFGLSDETAPEYAPILDIMDKYKFVCKVRIHNDEESPQRYLPDDYSHIYEDAWLRTCLSEIHIYLDEACKQNNIKEEELIKIKRLLCIFLYRQADDIYSAWKRETDFHSSYKKISKILGVKASQVKRLKPFVEGDPGIKDILEGHLKLLGEELESLEGVTLISSQPKHKIFSFAEHEKLELLCSGSSCSAEEASPYVASLRRVAEETPSLHVSFVSAGIKSNEEKLKKCDDLLHKHLANYVKKLFDNISSGTVSAFSGNDRRKNDIRVTNEKRSGDRRSGNDRRAAAA